MGMLHARSDHNFAPEWQAGGCYCSRGPWGFGWCILTEPSRDPWLRLVPRIEDNGAGADQRQQDEDSDNRQAGRV
jgi:hypothetical protein